MIADGISVPTSERPAGVFDMAQFGRKGLRYKFVHDRSHAGHSGLEGHPLTEPSAANQLVQKKLADMQTEIALGLQISLRVGRFG